MTTFGRPIKESGHSSWSAWKQALRLPSFSATIAPILVGSAYAWVFGAFKPILALLMVAAATACQAGANLANDYFDHQRGVDTLDRPGSSRVIQLGLLTPAQIKTGMIVAFTIATVLGLVIVAMTGWPILILALACLAVAVLYTGGPVPLGYVALGELAVFLAMGLAIPVGAFLALTGSITATSVLVALPNACLITALLHVNNLRDVVRDRDAGKRTIAMLVGRHGSEIVYATLLGAAYVLMGLLVTLHPTLWPVLGAAITVPRAVRLSRDVSAAQEEADFSRALRGTNRLLFAFGAFTAAGLVAVALAGI